jgi:gas vesicle protein
MDCMKPTKILLFFLAGAAVGSALGMLFAPDKGSETRRRIGEKGNELADSLKDRFNEAVEGVKQKVSTLKKTAEDVDENSYRVGKA